MTPDGRRRLEKKRSTGLSIEPSKSKLRATWPANLIASHMSRLIAPLVRRLGSLPPIR